MNEPNEPIDPRVRQSLEQLVVVPPRDAQAAARGRAQFLAQAESLSRGVSRADVPRHTGWSELLLNLFARKERFAMSTLMTVLVVVSLVFGGTGAAVYAAQDDLPTELLYGVKTLSEDVRLGLAGNPEAQVELSLEFANRRVEEITALNGIGIAPSEPVAARLQAQLDNALYVAAGMDDAGLNRALTRVQERIEQQIQRMAMVQANAPEEAQPILAQVQAMLAERHALAQMGLADPLAFRQRQRTRTGEPQPTPVHTPGSGIGPGPGISLTVAPGNGFGPGPGISLTVTPSGTFGPGPGISQTVTPGNGFGPGAGISQTVTPAGGYGPGPQSTSTAGGGGTSQPTPEPTGGGNPQMTPIPTGGGTPGSTPKPGGGGGGRP